VWIEIPEGFVYSSWVQPVKNEPQTPLTALPADSFYGEISVPFTEARAQPDPDAEIAYRMYYSVVLKVSSIRTGADGAIWYEVDDENLNPTERYWVTGQHLRLITPEEVTPISPDVTDKRIVANIQTHWLSAYEGKAEVFRTRFASGATFFEPDGSKRAATWRAARRRTATMCPAWVGYRTGTAMARPFTRPTGTTTMAARVRTAVSIALRQRPNGCSGGQCPLWRTAPAILK